MYIRRELEDAILNIFSGPQKKGLILAGIVGCGKTTLAHKVLKDLKPRYETFEFTGDDLKFRTAVSQDTAYLTKTIRSVTSGRDVLVFIDEVQKIEQAFDAVKYAHDQSGISFIVSGSNPDFLNTTARRRLQRRADFLLLTPFSMPEILSHETGIDTSCVGEFRRMILAQENPAGLGSRTLGSRTPDFSISLTDEIKKTVGQYLIYGGFPLAYLESRPEEKLVEIRKVVERGFESLSKDNDNISDAVKLELAFAHSREFGYQGLFQKTGIRRRDIINRTIDRLLNYGYLVKKKPLLLGSDKRSYLSVYSYTDPGMVTYLTGSLDLGDQLGARIEGAVHGRLDQSLRHFPLKSAYGYYKPFTIDANDKVKFGPGEIDLMIKMGRRIIPLEVKAADNLNSIKVPLLKETVARHHLPYGVVIYGGAPFYDQPEKIWYWPYWLF